MVSFEISSADDIPMIGVIIPVYNGQKYIKRCVESVARNAAQSPRLGIDAIVVDDGSTDKTVEIVEYLQEKYATVLNVRLFREKNCGVAAARNVGLRESYYYDYILFLDADDWLPDFAIEKLVKSAEKNGADITLGKSRYYLGRLPIISTSETWHKIESEIVDPHENNFLVEITPGVRAKLFRSEFFNELGFPTERIKWEDLALIPALLASAERISYVDEVVYNYTIHINTTIKDFFIRCNVSDILKSLDLLRETLKKLEAYDEFSAQYKSILTLHTLFRAENIVTWIGVPSEMKKKITKDLLEGLHTRYPKWEDDPVLTDPEKQYKDKFFNYMLTKLYL